MPPETQPKSRPRTVRLETEEMAVVSAPVPKKVDVKEVLGLIVVVISILSAIIGASSWLNHIADQTDKNAQDIPAMKLDMRDMQKSTQKIEVQIEGHGQQLNYMKESMNRLLDYNGVSRPPITRPR